MRDNLIQFVTVTFGIDNFLHLFVGLVALVRLSLSLDDSAPFVQVTLGIAWIVPLVVLRQRLKLISLVFQWLFDALCMNFEGVD